MTPPGPALEPRTPRAPLRIRGDRRLAFLGFVLALFYGAEALTLRSVGFSDPLGPRPFPLLLAALMIAAVLSLGARPTEHEFEPPHRRTGMDLGVLAGGLIAYGYLLEPLGYLLSTTAIVVLYSAVFGGPRTPALLAAAALAGSLYLIFSVALGLYLPAAPSF